MNELRAAIIDDEPLARARLRRLLAKVGGSTIRVVAECVDTDELLATAANCAIDVLFLDIEMPGGNGFGALARWQGPHPLVVFVTAYAQHGVRAFDARATDYLMKPVSAERLRDTLERVRHAAAHVSPATETPSGKRLPLSIGQRTHLVPILQIDLVLAHGNYLEVHAAGATYMIRNTLADFQAKLEPENFVRLHRSAIVRIAAIREIKPVGSGRFRIGLHGGRHLHSGRHFRDQVHALLGLDNTP
jgi:two-component system LytT family response regulator